MKNQGEVALKSVAGILGISRAETVHRNDLRQVGKDAFLSALKTGKVTMEGFPVIARFFRQILIGACLMGLPGALAASEATDGPTRVEVGEQKIHVHRPSGRDAARQVRRWLVEQPASSEEPQPRIVIYEGFDLDNTIVEDVEERERQQQATSGFYNGTILKWMDVRYDSTGAEQPRLPDNRSDFFATWRESYPQLSAIEIGTDVCGVIDTRLAQMADGWFLNRPLAREDSRDSYEIEEALELLIESYGMDVGFRDTSKQSLGAEALKGRLDFEAKPETVRELAYAVLSHESLGRHRGARQQTGQGPRVVMLQIQPVTYRGFVGDIANEIPAEIQRWTVVSFN